jgi:hypothetical protein
MRISLCALAIVMLGCCGLWARSAEPAAQLPAQQPAPPSSKPQTEATPQTQPAPAPNDLNQLGNAEIFQQAPPGVEEALRARLDLFYQCQVDATFRKAEQYVAEESKDRYYNGRHQKYFDYKIIKIKFSDDFSSAQVTVLVDVDLHFQGRVIRAPMPFTANWKLENGVWCWYVPIPKPGEIQHTPFGDVRTPDPKDLPKEEQPGDITKIGERFVNKEDILARFGSSPKLSKAVAFLQPDGNYQDQIYFANSTKVPFKFHIDKDLPPGITVEPLSGGLKPGEGVTLKISYKQTGSGTPPPMFHTCNIRYGDEDLKMPFYVKMGNQ